MGKERRESEAEGWPTTGLGDQAEGWPTAGLGVNGWKGGGWKGGGRERKKSLWYQVGEWKTLTLG